MNISETHSSTVTWEPRIDRTEYYSLTIEAIGDFQKKEFYYVVVFDFDRDFAIELFPDEIEIIDWLIERERVIFVGSLSECSICLESLISLWDKFQESIRRRWSVRRDLQLAPLPTFAQSNDIEQIDMNSPENRAEIDAIINEMTGELPKGCK